MTSPSQVSTFVSLERPSLSYSCALSTDQQTIVIANFSFVIRSLLLRPLVFQVAGRNIEVKATSWPFKRGAGGALLLSMEAMFAGDETYVTAARITYGGRQHLRCQHSETVLQPLESRGGMNGISSRNVVLLSATIIEDINAHFLDLAKQSAFSLRSASSARGHDIDHDPLYVETPPSKDDTLELSVKVVYNATPPLVCTSLRKDHRFVNANASDDLRSDDRSDQQSVVVVETIGDCLL